MYLEGVINPHCFLLTWTLIALVITGSGGDNRLRRFLPWGGSGGGGFGQFDLNNLLRGLGINPAGLTTGLSFRPQGGFQNSFDLGRNFGDSWGGGRDLYSEPDNGNQVPTTTGSGGDFAAAALAETNKYRAKHGAGPLILDPQLSAGCQAWAEKLAQSNSMKHSCSMCNDYGENLWMMGGQILDPAESARQAVKSWYDEVKMYNWNNPVFSGSTGHFTALVWKGSTKMGIGLATNKGSRSTYVVARYVPPGNMQGAFKENVGPLQGI